jgi:hypothetical protein
MQSPRWLLTRDRQEEALKSLKLLRQGAYTDEEINSEFEDMQRAINTTIKKGSFMDLFRGSECTHNLALLDPADDLQLISSALSSLLVSTSSFSSRVRTLVPSMAPFSSRALER